MTAGLYSGNARGLKFPTVAISSPTFITDAGLLAVSSLQALETGAVRG
ncbi:MAG: hypothetical protein ACJ76J_29650 [Thermoanaerobaculia bacterium]